MKYSFYVYTFIKKLSFGKCYLLVATCYTLFCSFILFFNILVGTMINDLDARGPVNIKSGRYVSDSTG